MRAGGFGLNLLAPPGHATALKGLEERSIAPDDRPLAVLSSAGLVELRDNATPAITRSGLGLVSVARTVDRWLASAPDGPLQLGGRSARSVIQALLGGWSSGIVRALAARPFSSAELHRLLPHLKPAALEARLHALSRKGLVEAGLATDDAAPIAVSDWLRYAMVPLAASARWERQYLPAESAPIGAIDVESALLLTVPLAELPEGVSGACRLAVRLPSIDTRVKRAGVVVQLRQGAVVSCTSRLDGEVDSEAEGSARGWLRAALEGDIGRLDLGGDRALSEALLRALAELFGALSAADK